LNNFEIKKIQNLNKNSKSKEFWNLKNKLNPNKFEIWTKIWTNLKYEPIWKSEQNCNFEQIWKSKLILNFRIQSKLK
jgi:hypothetical protein